MNRWVSPFEPKTKGIAAIEIITVGLGLYINSGTRQLNYTEDETWCRAGVSASIETRNSTGRATPSSAALRRQTRAYIAVRGGIFVTLTLQGQDRRPNTLLDADALGVSLYRPTRVMLAVAMVGICMAVNATTSRSPRSRSRGP